jgi:arabinan endo-1,5-alpha-L-arabinosidase
MIISTCLLACSQSGSDARPGAGGNAATGGAIGSGGSGGTDSGKPGTGGISQTSTASGGMETATGGRGTGGATVAAGGSGGAVRDAANEGGRATDGEAVDLRPLDTAASEVRDTALEQASADAPQVYDGAGCPAPGPGTFATSTTHQNIGVHDPSMMSDGKRFYLFATGGSLSIRSSADGIQWTSAGKVFASVPGGVTTAVKATELWAPDISFFDCKYHLYYTGSTFGSNSSVIGLATSPSLDPKDPSYGWTDQGLVVQSKSSDSFNAIDPNVAFDDTGTPWLSFGSFWDGIKMRRLDPSTGKPSTSDTTLYSLASRKGTGNAIEAPSIVSHNGYYYLFVSFDTCCKGVDSTYRTMVGRATKITGPYSDKAGTAMTKGGATELLASQGRYVGPGGGTAFLNGQAHYYAFHYYDGSDNGASKLQIRPIGWDAQDWPTLGDPLFP